MLGKFVKMISQIFLFCLLSSAPFAILLGLNGLILENGKELFLVVYGNLLLAFIMHELGHLIMAWTRLSQVEKISYIIKWNLKGVSQIYKTSSKKNLLLISVSGSLCNFFCVFLLNLFNIQNQPLVSFSILIGIISILPGSNDFNSIKKSLQNI
jgi:hypothetical protein